MDYKLIVSNIQSIFIHLYKPFNRWDIHFDIDYVERCLCRNFWVPQNITKHIVSVLRHRQNTIGI